MTAMSVQQLSTACIQVKNYQLMIVQLVLSVERVTIDQVHMLVYGEIQMLLVCAQ